MLRPASEPYPYRKKPSPDCDAVGAYMDSISGMTLLGEREKGVTAALWETRETFLALLTEHPHVQREMVLLMQKAGKPGVRLDATFESHDRSLTEYRSVIDDITKKAQAVLDAYDKSPDDPSIAGRLKEAGKMLLQCRLHFHHYTRLYNRLADEGQAVPQALATAFASYVALKQELVEGNLFLGISLAGSSRYRQVSLPLQDRIEEANVALLHAADRFDPRKGVKFATYATWWIQCMIDNAVRGDHTVEASLRIRRNKAAFERVSNELSQESGHTSTADEICAQMGLSYQDFRALLPFLRTPHSLDKPRRFVDSDRAPQDDPVDREPTVPAEANRRLLHATLHEALQELSGRTSEILIRRAQEETLQDIGRSFGITRERVRQIEMRGQVELLELLKMRLPSLAAPRDSDAE